MRRFVRGAGTPEVETFGADHPGAVTSGARVFYVYRRAVARSGDVRRADDLM